MENIPLLGTPPDYLVRHVETAERLASGTQEGRIRTVLGITAGALPKVEVAWLYRYYEHLLAQLVLPCEARYTGDLGALRQLPRCITALGLVDPTEHATCEKSGILCQARHEGSDLLELDLVDLAVDETSPNFQAIEDYWYWFWNWRFDPQI